MKIIVIIIAIMLGFGWALYFMTVLLHKGSNFGIDTGNYKNYADKPVNYIKMEDKIKKIE